ncbi:HBR020Cp [Eremothecium sinecaudum]|uniref:HBR020Cp n=1 Tax=Eremothecium sinecaudum TaxID=45286 RepID=A0A125RDY5_9SACH|nr:HBR020Cp [Eremothecium sinecaudum]AMD18921.1 HBR020Cp [Eremothecium sinecaudum]
MNNQDNNENLVASTSTSSSLNPRTPVHQLKKVTSNLIPRSSRLPLAAKDKNRSQRGYNVKQKHLKCQITGNTQNASKKPPSKNFCHNIPESKLKKYGSVLGIPYQNLTKTKSLVLKDASDGVESEDDDVNPLAVKLKSRLISNVDQENEEVESSGLLAEGGLRKLIKLHSSCDEDSEEDIPQIETTSKKIPELRHIPNGYEEFKDDSITKLATYNSPFIRLAGDTSDNESSEDEDEAISLDFGTIEGSPSLEDEIMPRKLHNLASNSVIKDGNKDSEDADAKFEFDFEVGEGLNSKEMQSLLD